MSPDLIAGRYELIERIAGGGMGQVWRGRDRVLERIVAVKTVDLSAQEPTARERFRREAIATAGLSAPNIVQVYDAGVDDKTAYLVMELLTGPTLSQVIHDGGPMGISEGLHVALEVARALQTAHRIGIVHRDIKPGNVMYQHDQVKLLDFGIAQLARNLGAALTAPATALGTAAYMSPEQAAGEGATEKSDWYALGCLLTTMFTGQPPFSGDPLAVANQQINGKPPFLSERRPEIPPALDQLVAVLLAKDPAARPSGEQVVEQLRQLASDPSAGTAHLPGATDSTVAWTAGGTALMAGAAAGALPADATRRVSYGEGASTPVSPGEPVAPVSPVPPPPVQRTKQKRPVGLIITVIVLALAVALGAAYLLLNQDGPTGPIVAPPTATATPTPSPTSTRTTRPAPTRPATTRPPTTAPPTTSAPTFTQEPTAPTSEPTAEGGEDDAGDADGEGDGDVEDQGQG